MAESRLASVIRDGRFLLGVTFACALVAFSGPLMSYDLWWHMRAGALIAQTGSVPKVDPFSFTAAGRPWVNHSWLGGLALFGVWNALGASGLIFFQALLMAVSVALSWAAARQRGVGPALASILALAACLQLELMAVTRPYLFSFLFFVAFLAVLQGLYRASYRGEEQPDGGAVHVPGRPFSAELGFLWGRQGRLALLPGLMLPWANLHAGFVTGLLLLGAYGAGEMVAVWLGRSGRHYMTLLLKGGEGARFRAMLAAGIMCLLVALVTPYGPQVLLYPFTLLHGVKLLKRVQEWQPMPLRPGFAVFWGTAVLGALILVRSFWLSARAGRLRSQAGILVADALLLAGFSFLAMRAMRNMAWVLLLAPAILGYHADPPWAVEDEDRKEKGLYAVAACLMALAIGLWPLITGGPPRLVISERRLPVKACDYIQAKGLYYRAYNSYEWGGYLIWRFWPTMKVFIDGRCDVYRDDLMGQALAVEDAEAGWQSVLEHWGVQMLLVRYRKRDSAHLFADGRWRCLYWDDVAVLALRDDVLKGRSDGLQEFSLSNPAVFEQNLQRVPAADMLRELDAVLARDPGCWTALAHRARCLVRMAGEEPKRREELLRSAFSSAQRAVELEEAYDTWRAVAEVASALGQESLARRASGKADRLKPTSGQVQP
jgi:hypothetical protein